MLSKAKMYEKLLKLRLLASLELFASNLFLSSLKAS